MNSCCIVSGDCQNDSPGYSASYGTYTLMDHTTGRIIAQVWKQGCLVYAGEILLCDHVVWCETMLIVFFIMRTVEYGMTICVIYSWSVWSSEALCSVWCSLNVHCSLNELLNVHCCWQYYECSLCSLKLTSFMAKCSICRRHLANFNIVVSEIAVQIVYNWRHIHPFARRTLSCARKSGSQAREKRLKARGGA